MRGLRAVTAGTIALAALYGWREAAALSCGALALPAAAAILIAVGLREAAVTRRRCLATCTFEPDTLLRRLFGSAFWPTVGGLLLGTLGAAALALDLLVWRETAFLVLGGGAVLLLALLTVFMALVRSSVRPGMRPWIVKRWAVALNTLALVAALSALTLVSPIPPYIDRDLQATLLAAAGQVSSACPYLAEAAGLAGARDGLFWWVALRSDQAVGAGVWEPLRWGAWALFLATTSLSAFAFSRLMAELLFAAAYGRDDR